METGVIEFSKQANDKINRKVEDLVKELYFVVEQEAKRHNVKNPNWIIINSQTLTLSILHNIITTVNTTNIKYAQVVTKELNKREQKGIGG